MPKMSGSRIFIECLLREGVDHVFGYAGATICPIMDEMLAFRDKIGYTLVREEQNAGHMASGYARISRKVGVALVTSGPGATNLITGIATAYLDSVPLVAVTGQVPTNLLGKDIFQEVDITGSVTPFIKYSYLIKDAADIPRIVKEAFYIAGSGRPGPVLIDFPQNIQEQEIDEPEFPDEIHIRGYNPTIRGNARQLVNVIEAISVSERPVICAGGGIFLADARKELTEFARRMNIPVVTTMMGLSLLDTDDPLNMGMIGRFGNRSANKAMVKADLMIMIGMRVADRAIYNAGEVKKRLTTIHIDIDTAEIGKNIEANIPLVGNAKLILEKLIEKCEPRDTSAWTDFLAKYRDEELTRSFPDKGKVSPQRFMRELGRLLDDKAVVCADVGQNQIWACQHLYMHGVRFLTSGGLGTMGYALPAAIGAKTAAPSRQMVVINGDGSFQMSMNELAAIKAAGLDIKIVVIRNHYLGLVNQIQLNPPYHGSYGVALDGDPDLEVIFAAYEIPVMRLSSEDNMSANVRAFLEQQGAAALIVDVDPSCSTLD